MPDREKQGVAFTASSVTEADIVKGLLESEGIMAVVQGADMASMLDGMVTGNKGIDVLVRREQLEEAIRVIEANHQPVDEEDLEDAEEESADD
jgi:S-adenosylhomocysteine hydrolase